MSTHPTTPLKVRPVEWSVGLRACRARLPFRFGIHTLTAAPLCLLRLRVETDAGLVVEGFASDLLVPKWFEKNPDTPVTRDWDDLLTGLRAAADAATENARPDSVFEHWRRVRANRVACVPAGAPDRLRRGHGVSMVERAMIDAACRDAGLSFGEAIRADLLGFRPGSIAPEIEDVESAVHLARSSAETIGVRHTVGLADALTEAEIDEEDRVADGHPESLEADIETYALRLFKVKIAGDREAIVDRLTRVARIVRARAGDPARFTLDANEQFTHIGELAETLDAASADGDAAWLLERVMFVEQPLHRSRSFDPAACAGIDSLDRYGGCIIDEADDSLDALARAAAIGYRGVSVKNCKGVFSALINRLRCVGSMGRLIQSGEDLTNLPVVSLQQDLATMDAVGITHVERNGHHYFRGLGHLPGADQHEALARHADLYERVDAGGRLAIRDGCLSLRSVRAAKGYAYDGPVAFDDWTPLDQWSPESLLQTGDNRP